MRPVGGHRAVGSAIRSVVDELLAVVIAHHAGMHGHHQTVILREFGLVVEQMGVQSMRLLWGQGVATGLVVQADCLITRQSGGVSGPVALTGGVHAMIRDDRTMLLEEQATATHGLYEPLIGGGVHAGRFT